MQESPLQHCLGQLMLANDHPWVLRWRLSSNDDEIAEEHLSSKRGQTPRGAGEKWRRRHEALQEAMEKKSGKPSPSLMASLPSLSSAARLTEREREGFKLTWQLKKGRPDLVVDLSQSAGRMPCAFNGQCPTILPGSKLWVVKSDRELVPEEVMLMLGFPMGEVIVPEELQ